MTPEEFRRIPLAIPTGEGTWVCPTHGRVVFRANQGGYVSHVIPDADKTEMSIPFGERDYLHVMDWRSGARTGRPAKPQGNTRGFAGHMLATRCAPGGCRVRLPMDVLSSDGKRLRTS